MFIALSCLIDPRSAGAECKLNLQKHIALRRSGMLISQRGYKHGAPPVQRTSANGS